MRVDIVRAYSCADYRACDLAACAGRMEETMKLYEEREWEQTVVALPVCTECENEILLGEKCYQSPSGLSFLCKECGEKDL